MRLLPKYRKISVGKEIQRECERNKEKRYKISLLLFKKNWETDADFMVLGNTIHLG